MERNVLKRNAMADQKGLNLSKYTPKLPDSNEYLLGRTTYVYTNLY